MKKSVAQVPEVARPAVSAGITKKQDLMEMLTSLRENNLLTDAELAAKIKLLINQQL